MKTWKVGGYKKNIGEIIIIVIAKNEIKAINIAKKQGIEVQWIYNI